MWHSRKVWLALTLAAVVTVSSVAMGLLSQPRAASATSELKVVFAALERDGAGNTHGMQAIYVANGDGTSITRITPAGDGKFYDWPMWVMNGAKILFTARDTLLTGGPEPIYMMDPDGTDVVQLTQNPWRNGQPKLSPDGASIVFTSLWDEFPVVALYRLWLGSGQIENLSARHSFDSGFDSDPSWSPDGKQIVFASSRGEDGKAQPTQIYLMNAEGTGRRRLTNDTNFNTDPVLSPDGRSVAISAYRGEGRPTRGSSENDFAAVRLHDWSLVVKDMETLTNRVLTAGGNCTTRAVTDPCALSEASAWVPKWSSDGSRIGFISLRSPAHTGIYVMDADGKNGAPLIELQDKAITWFDWTSADGPAQAATPALPTPSSGLLFGGNIYDVLTEGGALPPPQLFMGWPDRWNSWSVRSAQASLEPLFARWTQDKQRILFTARAAVDRSQPPQPVPAGQVRRVHFRYGDPMDDGSAARPEVAEEQVFMMAADGTGIRQLTTAQTEDYMDAIPEGEARGNTDPDISPDGRYVIFTNVSDTTTDSWILRKDLQNGEVLNLTSMTRGPFPGRDERPRFSPDGKRIVFTSSVGATMQILLMDPDGLNVRQLTNDTYMNVDPAWSPDGQWVVYSSQRQSSKEQDPLKDWYLVRVNVTTGEQVSMTTNKDLSAFRPVWSPDGQRIAFIGSYNKGQTDIYSVTPDGGGLGPLQVTLRTKEAFVDWR